METDRGDAVRRRNAWRRGWMAALAGVGAMGVGGAPMASVTEPMPALHDLPATDLVAARDEMAHWQPVETARLDALRGGYETAGLQVSFGISRAVFVNGDLVVSTSLVIPDVSRITSEQASRLASALQNVAVAGANAAATGAAAGQTAAQAANAAVNSALTGQPGAQPGTVGPAQAAVGQPGAGGAPVSAPVGPAVGTAGTAPPPAAASVAGQAAQPVPATSASSAIPVAGAPAAAVIGTATGTVATNGLLSLVQNGPGNSFQAASLANTPATIIQNTLNNQSIQSLLTIDTGVNTLQAFRAGIVGSALDSALQRAASLR